MKGSKRLHLLNHTCVICIGSVLCYQKARFPSQLANTHSADCLLWLYLMIDINCWWLSLSFFHLFTNSENWLTLQEEFLHLQPRLLNTWWMIPQHLWMLVFDCLYSMNIIDSCWLLLCYLCIYSPRTMTGQVCGQLLFTCSSVL